MQEDNKNTAATVNETHGETRPSKPGMAPVTAADASATIATEDHQTASTVASDVSDAIDAWWTKVSRNSPLSRNTAALNYVREKLPELKAALEGSN